MSLVGTVQNIPLEVIALGFNQPAGVEGTPKPNPLSGLVVNSLSGSFELGNPSTPNSRVQFQGVNFTYNAGNANNPPTGGTINALSFLRDGQVVATLTGIATVSAVSLYNALTSDSLSAYLALVALFDDDTTITGAALNDRFEAGAGNDTVNTLGGNDRVNKWSAGNLTYDAGTGVDTLSFQAQDGPAYPNIPTQRLVVDLATGVGQNPYGGTLALTSVENIIGTGGFFGAFTGDSITGSDAANIIGDGIYDGGDDTVSAGGGNDIVKVSTYTRSGARYDGGGGSDELRFAIESFFNGSNAVLDLRNQALNAGVFQGVTVSNFETFTVANSSVTLRSFTFRGTDSAESVTGSEFVSGTSTPNGRDTLLGFGGNDTLNGLGGDDSIDGGDGDDSLSGGTQNDTLTGGTGNDTLDGGAGTDTANYADRALAVAINPFINTAAVSGGELDTILNIENFTGGSGNDTIQGTFGVNVIAGGGGNDLIYAFDGADLVDGGAGNDVIAGGIGDDTITGGDGGDWLYGEDGNDNLSGTAKSGGAFDVIVGGNGADTLEGSGGGFDYFYGGVGVNGATGDGNDTYVVRAATGIKVMNDFEVGGTADVIRLLGTGLTTFAQVQAALSFSGVINGTVLVVDGTTQIWFLNGTQPANLTAADFAFV